MLAAVLRSWSSNGNSGKMVAGRQVWASSSGATMAITTEDEERYRLGQPQECRGRPGEKWALTEIGLGSNWAQSPITISNIDQEKNASRFSLFLDHFPLLSRIKHFPIHCRSPLFVLECHFRADVFTYMIILGDSDMVYVEGQLHHHVISLSQRKNKGKKKVGCD